MAKETEPSVWEAFRTVDGAMRKLGIPFAFMGAAAAGAWGRPRATTDVDCVALASVDDWLRLRGELLALGFVEGKHVGPADPADAHPDMAVFWTAARSGVRVDIFIAKLEFEREAVRHARTGAPSSGLEFNVISPEFVVIYKLLASRGKDLLDVEWLFEARAVVGDRLDWPLMDRWAAEWEITDRLKPWRDRYGPR